MSEPTAASAFVATLGNQPVETRAVAPAGQAPAAQGDRAQGDRPRGPREVAGTHQGKIDPEQRARRTAKNARTASHSGQGTHKACNEYPGCNHPKHGRKP